MEMYGRTSAADVLTKRLVETMIAQDRIVICSRRGNWAYNTWLDGAHPLGFVRRTPWNAWIEGNPQWEVVLEVDALDLTTETGTARAGLWPALILFIPLLIAHWSSFRPAVPILVSCGNSTWKRVRLLRTDSNYQIPVTTALIGSIEIRFM
ncbi:hypothetical protein AWV80_35675 [Cupriavidus sp. UYMU48A]|nr:hypothetical protein AWV80_35675 [Cupriavidus sp. UYMU48A]